MKTIVIKIGSSSLTDAKSQLDLKNLRRLVKEISLLHAQNHNFIIVTSGSIVTGQQRLGKQGRPNSIPEKQAAAAVGQIILMKNYAKAFKKHKIVAAQILLTRDVIEEKERKENTFNTLSTLLKHRVIPIINENDTVAVDEIKFGDNDNLSALVARLIKADLLINLTDVDGFYINNQLMYEINEISEHVIKAASHSASDKGTGGMITKIEAAKICMQAKIPLVIAHGRKRNLLEKIVNQKKIGTWFVA